MPFDNDDDPRGVWRLTQREANVQARDRGIEHARDELIVAVTEAVLDLTYSRSSPVYDRVKVALTEFTRSRQ